MYRFQKYNKRNESLLPKEGQVQAGNDICQFPGERQAVTLMHTCCDFCALACKCGPESNQCALRGSPKLHQSKLEHSLNESTNKVERTSQNSCDNQATKRTLDGKQYLLGKLTEFHTRHLAKHEECGKLFVGMDIASGWPANSIKKIIDNVQSILEPRDIQKICVIYDDDVSMPIFELIEETKSLYYNIVVVLPLIIKLCR